MTIRHGDIIELIPGQYLFLYKKFSGNSHIKGSNCEGKAVEVEELSRKRSHQLGCEENDSNSKRYKVSFFFMFN